MASHVSYSGFQRLVVRCLCALALLQFPRPTESVDETKIELSCQNSDQSCEEILRGEFSNPLPDCEEIGHGNVFSTHSIDNTQLLQPSITLTVNSSQIDTDYQDNFQYTGYVIGYRGCTNNPTEQCSSYISSLPSHWDNWIHILSPKEDTKLLSPEEQCTFFGCFLYTEENVSGGCRKRILGDIFVENITILATCPHPGDSVENGSVSFTLPLVDSTRYLGGTVANVTCDEGFVATHGGVSECQSDGTWNTTVLPTCKRQCDELETSIDGGWIEISDITRTVHTTATATCYDKYFTGGGNIICGENGNWSQSSLPQCNPAKCPAVQSIDGGDVDVASPVSRYKPSEGFFLVNTTITVTCHEYYTGGGSVTCGNGKWTSSLPLCFPVKCLEPMPDVDHGRAEVNTPHNGSAVYGHYLVNTTIRVSCDKGYIGGGSITCGRDGNWTSPLPSCSRGYWPIIASVVAVTLTLLLTSATIFIFCCKIYWTHRYDKVQRFFMIQARNESLDPNYAPINLGLPRKIQSNDEYYPAFKDSITSLLPQTIATTEVQPLTRSQSLDDILNVPHNITTPGPYIKENGNLSEGATEKSLSRSCPSLPYVQHGSAKAGFITTKPSENEDEHLDIVFQFPEGSATAVSSGESGPYCPPTNYSGIVFKGDSMYPPSSDKNLTGYGPFPKESTESIFISESVIADELFTGHNLQDPAAIEGETVSAPTNRPGYINIGGEGDSLDETLIFSPLSPQIPSGVTLAFATVDEPTGRTKHHSSDSASQTGSSSDFERYMNSCSGYTEEISFSCTVESGYTGEPSSEVISESSVKSSPGDMPGQSEGDVSFVPSENQPCAPISAYIRESDLCNRSRSPVGQMHKYLVIPRATQSFTDHNSSTGSQFSQMNSGLGYVVLEEPSTSSTA